jgi:hypothetical protein
MMKVLSSFETYALTEDEQKMSTLFSSLQLARLHNLRTTYALARLDLTFDPTKPTKFMQEEAALHGSIEVLTLLIDEAIPSQ